MRAKTAAGTRTDAALDLTAPSPGCAGAGRRTAPLSIVNAMPDPTSRLEPESMPGVLGVI